MPRRISQTRSGFTLTEWFVLSVTLSLAAAVLLATVRKVRGDWLGESPSGPVQVARTSTTPIITSSLDDTFDFGAAERGSWKSLVIQLTNTSAHAIQIDRIEKSCPCVRFELPKRPFLPSETVSAELVVDLTTERDFEGPLKIEVKGIAADGREVFKLVVRVEVT